MSWFAKSISGLLGETDDKPSEQREEQGEHGVKSVKEDLSELKKSFTKQLWGVAAFLAPPPRSDLNDPNLDSAGSHESSILQNTVFESNEASFSGQNLADKDVSLDSSPILLASTEEPVQILDGDSNLHEERWRSDIEDLRGGFSKGLSKLSSVIRVVAGDDSEESFSPRKTKSGDAEELDRSTSFNLLLKPLYSNILSGDEALDEPEEQAKSSLSNDRKTSGVKLPTALVSHIQGISKFASSLLPFVDESQPFQSFETVGVTDEVATFAKSIAMHPETWLDFPTFMDDEDCEDFEMNDIQQEHAEAVEIVAPRLAALKIELCPHHMSEARFWKIYFVLLHSRLSKDYAALLSTPQVLEARSRMLQELQRRELQKEEYPLVLPNQGNPILGPIETSSVGLMSSSGLKVPEDHFSMSNASTLSTTFKPAEDQKSTSDVIQGKSMVIDLSNTGEKKKFAVPEDDAEVDEWLEDEPSDEAIRPVSFPLVGNEDEDVSFSDLEDEEVENHRTVDKVPKKPQGWVELTHSSQEVLAGSSGAMAAPQEHTNATVRFSERVVSNDWLTVDEED